MWRQSADHGQKREPTRLDRLCLRDYRKDSVRHLRVAFALDCCDREAMSFVATTGGISGDDVRDLMGRRRASVRQGQLLAVTIEWLSDNGSCYIAGDTRSFARDIGLEPRTTPIESPQNNGMAEAFVRTIKRDYVRVSPKPNAGSVMLQLPLWIATTTRFTRTRLSDIVPRVSSL
jgi:putative transposase